jgi:gentisate 1,2-dioxygenase
MTDTEARSAPERFDSAEHQARLRELYRDFEAAGMTPLWLTREGLMPFHPQPRAVPHLWRWADLLPLAARSAELVPVGRGGERRAISLGNPGLTGDPYTTPTLWAAIQYLAPREDAPEHRHTQSAFRFVLEGEGVWTVVDGDPVAMRRGDLLLTPGWAFHGHQNVSDAPMAWLDGLDIPLVAETDQGFFEFGPDQVRNRETPDRSASERLWGQPGLTPVALAGTRPASPLVAYRWAHTDAALAAQLELEAAGNRQGLPGVLEPGHAAVRYTNPAGRGHGHPPVAHLGVLGLAGLRRHRFGPAERVRAPAGARRRHRRPGLDRVLPDRRWPAGPVHVLRRARVREAEPAPY